MNDDKILRDVLKKNGYSVTNQRKAVFKAMLHQEPLSMRQLIKNLQGQIDRVSVYRTIDVFEKIGVVQRLTHGWKYKLELSDAFSEHHHHLTCVNCGKVIAINKKELENFIDQVASEKGFKPERHQLEIQGLCRDCQMKQLI